MTDPSLPPADASVDPPITDAELRALGLRARQQADAPLRRLLASYLTLRRVTADVVLLIEAREGGATIARTPLLLRARQLADPSRR